MTLGELIDLAHDAFYRRLLPPRRPRVRVYSEVRVFVSGVELHEDKKRNAP